MEVKIRSLSVLALVLFLALVSVEAARDLKSRNVLNVRAALAVARGEAVEEKFQGEEVLGEDETLAVMSLPLVHRDIVLMSSNASFEERLKQRLQRDAARVEAINARLELALNGLSTSDLKPQGTATEVASLADFQSPVVSGTQQGSGEYFTRVGVGSPAKEQLVVLDTGSDIVWIQCEPCSDCYSQSDPIFNPSMSTTYNGLKCDSNQCQELDVSGCSRSGTCIYQVNYGDGSYTIGSFATDTITLGKTPVQNIAIGCGHDNEGLFVGAAGLLGLGGGALSFPSQLPDSESKIFSYCLVDRDSSSSSTLQFGRQAVPRGAVFAPMLKNSRMDTFYYVSLSGLSVGGNMLSIPQSVFQLDASGNGGIIVDSGTAVTRLQTAAYDALRDAFVAGTQDLPSANGVSLFDTCYDLSNKDSVSVPTVAFHFPSGGSLSLPAKNYLVPVDSAGIFCFAFAPVSSSLSIIGNIQQQGIRVSYDPANKQVGFGASEC